MQRRDVELGEAFARAQQPLVAAAERGRGKVLERHVAQPGRLGIVARAPGRGCNGSREIERQQPERRRGQRGADLRIGGGPRGLGGAGEARDRRLAGKRRDDLGQRAGDEHVPVPGRAERAGDRAEPVLEIGHVGTADRRAEQRQRRAQPPDRHARLMHALGVRAFRRDGGGGEQRERELADRPAGTILHRRCAGEVGLAAPERARRHAERDRARLLGEARRRHRDRPVGGERAQQVERLGQRLLRYDEAEPCELAFRRDRAQPACEQGCRHSAAEPKCDAPAGGSGDGGQRRCLGFLRDQAREQGRVRSGPGKASLRQHRGRPAGLGACVLAWQAAPQPLHRAAPARLDGESEPGRGQGPFGGVVEHDGRLRAARLAQPPGREAGVTWQRPGRVGRDGEFEGDRAGLRHLGTWCRAGGVRAHGAGFGRSRGQTKRTSRALPSARPHHGVATANSASAAVG